MAGSMCWQMTLRVPLLRQTTHPILQRRAHTALHRTAQTTQQRTIGSLALHRTPQYPGVNSLRLERLSTLSAYSSSSTRINQVLPSLNRTPAHSQHRITHRYYCSKPKIVLGIETSCDDTAAAVVSSNKEILSESLNCQIKTHLETGGIIPPVARDLHKANIDAVVNDAMNKANVDFSDLNAVAVSDQPGLVTCLRVGLDKAISLCETWGKPLIPIHHMKAHALTIRLLENVEFPFLVLLASGGHCLITIAHNVDDFTLIGHSLHDSPGECLDKIARRLNLKNIPGFENLSGGQAIEKLAVGGDPKLYPVYNTMTQIPDCNFSFSGMKSHFNRVIERLEKEHNCSDPSQLPMLSDICASAQYSVTHHLCRRSQRAFLFCDIKELLPQEGRTLVLSGGVGSNQFVRQSLSKVCEQYGCKLVCPPPRLCTDNGVMIAWNGLEKLEIGSGLVYKNFHHMDVLGKSPIGKDVGDEILGCHLVKLQKIKLV